MNGPRGVPTRSSSARSGAFGLSKILPPASRCGLGGPAVRSWMHGSWRESEHAPLTLPAVGSPCVFSVRSGRVPARCPARGSAVSMALIAQKYGGTSVGNPDRIKSVAARVAGHRAKGDQIVVVVSAMSGVTDSLIKIAKEIMPLPSEREMDMLLATGEQTTIALT